MPGTRVSLKRAIAGALLLTSFVGPLPAPRPAIAAAGYLTDNASHPPPTSDPYAYYATYGTFGPTNSGFPAKGDSFVDPVFGSTIRRLTNEVGQSSDSEIYSRNGWFNADGTLVHHRGPNSRQFINPKTGQVVRSGMPGNFDSSFAADDPDTWYYWNNGSPDLMKYSVASGQSTKVKTFPGSLGQLGGSVDWMDRTGRYMALSVSGSIRVYDKQTDTLYSGSINGNYGGGWVGMSPDGNYVLMSRSGSPDQSQSYKIDHGNKSVSTSAVTFWTLCGGHADAVSASNGKTYWVSLDCNSTGALFAADVTIPQTSGNVQKQINDNKKLIQLTWSDDVHISRISRGPMQDWAVISVESGGDGFTSSVSGWYPFKQEIFMVNVLTAEVRRLAHHRSRGDLGSNYFWQPRVSASWDGAFVAWTSNMGLSQSGYADLYVVDTGMGDGGSGGGGGSTALSASFTSPASGATLSGITTVGMAAAGGSGSGYSYTLKVDGTTVSTGPASYAWNTAAVTNGSHTLSVTATDSAGGSATATRTVTVQNTGTPPPPTTLNVSFTNPASGATVSGMVTVSVTAGTSGTTTAAAGAYTYTVKAGTTTIYSGTNGSFSWNTTTSPNGALTLTATATDGNGGSGSATRNVTVSNTTTPPPGSGDTTPPTATITKPTSNVWTGNSIDIVATATDNVALSKIELWGNGQAFKTVTCSGTSCSTGTVWWSTGALTGAAYEVHAVAYDTAGNKTLSAPRTIYKNGTSPVVPSGATGGTTPPPPSTITASFTSPAAGATVSGTVTVGMSVSGGSGSTTFTLKLGSTTLSTQTVSGSSASYAWNTTGVANGSQTLSLTATNGGGTATATRTVTVSNVVTPPPPPPSGDTTPPTVKITKPGNNAWTGNSIDVAATATDNVKLKSIQLYGNGTLFGSVNCSSTSCSTGTIWWSTKSLPSGKHTIKAVATDAAGNQASTTVTINK